MDRAVARPARWVSRYCSVTYNQGGRDNPSGGINEAELVVELRWLQGSACPAPDQRPAAGWRGGRVRVPAPGDSLSRFERTAESVAGYRRRGADEALSFAFETLRNIAGARTQWSIVYDIGEWRVHFKTHRQPAIGSLRLKNLNFCCAAPVLVLGLNAPRGGDMLARLRLHSRESNLAILRASSSATGFLVNVQDEEIRRISGLPEAARCVEASRSGVTTP